MGPAAGRWVRIAAVVLAAVCLAMPAEAREEILSYDALVEVNPDSSLTVTETITVRAERNRIKRGIYRDFPTRYTEELGYVRKVGFSVLEITRDGNDEPYFTEGISQGRRVYIGDKDVYLQPGVYTYRLKYRTTRQLRYFDDYDELYWNVTGNRWIFPIIEARARVILPEGAVIRQKAAYTGYFGANGEDYRIVAESVRGISFATTRSLSVNEGLTIAVAWQKGVVDEPSFLTRFVYRLLDNLGFLILVGGAVGMFAYFYSAWSRYGRDPERGVVFPIYRPPEGFSPAAVSFLHYMGFAQAGRGATKPFVAALTSLAVKGWLTIDDDDGEMSLIAGKTSTDGLPLGESRLFDHLLGGRDKITFNKSFGRTIMTAHALLQSAVRSEYGDAFFRNNYGRYAIGAAIGIVSLVAFLPLQQPADEQIGIFLTALIGGIGGSLLLALGGRRLLNWVPGGSSKFFGFLLTALGVVVMAPTLLLPLAAVGRMPVYLPLAVLVIAVSLVAFFFLMRAPTVVGRKVMDEIEGFKLYLSVAETERLNLMGAPDLNATLYEKYLPYAIGLGVEQPWSEAFEANLARTAPESGSGSYQPHWYRGSAWDSGSIGRAAGTMVSAVGASMASAMPKSSG
ncbi:MAG: DUF2207 domain-containing protein, partial [Hyphomicrobiales bacterium]|nr:DUF2207 domain-containing protein [Hyphomicrobiales bacterium]